MRMGMTAAVLLLVAGCAGGGRPDGAATPGRGSAAAAGDAITVATGACFGSCPVYTVTIRPDGTGTFDGQRFTAVTGTRAFAADAATYRRVAASLARYRPQGERRIEMGAADCPTAPTDMPSTQVRWGERDRLDFYHGCRMGNEELAKALDAVPAMLPIASLIGERSAFTGQR